MINTVSDLLLKLKDKEQVLLKQYDYVKHPGIIGDMYEGLTKEILSKSIFEGLNLHVRAGKIKNSKNDLSGEIDCMIVIGEGDEIPHTDKHIYSSDNVIAVIQVKKNLFSKDIKESFENLKTVTDVTEMKDGEPYHGKIIRNTWRLLFNEELPEYEKLNELPIEKEMLYHVLLMEAFYPARIVWGYNGFKSEFSLRESFVEYLEDNISTTEETRITGFGPLGFPNLIICDKYSLVKTNGIPFAHPVLDDNSWPFYVSSNDNPVYFLLEVIWTRLHFMFGISAEIFGDDLSIDQMHGFLLCKYKEANSLKGWEYNYIELDKKFLIEPLVPKEWSPAILDKTQFVIINKLCRNKKLDLKDKNTLEYIESNGYTLDSFIVSLKVTGLINETNHVLSLITDECLCGILSDGNFFAGENKTGRVTRWATKEMNKKTT